VIDRGVGVGLLIALGFVVLLLPSGLTALGGYRDVVLVSVYGELSLVGALGLLLGTEDRSAARSLAVFPLVRDIGHRQCSSRSRSAAGVCESLR
jgi:hypothetical protein